MLVPLHSKHSSAEKHSRAQVPPHTQLPLPSHRQAEKQQGGVHQPRDQMAAAVPEERTEQNEKSPATTQLNVCQKTRSLKSHRHRYVPHTPLAKLADPALNLPNTLPVLNQQKTTTPPSPPM